MKKIGVIGSDNFCLGFEIVGCIKIDLKSLETEVLKSKTFGIVIIEKKLFETLNLRVKNLLENSQSPIIIKLGDSLEGSTDIKKLVKKALGIDMKN